MSDNIAILLTMIQRQSEQIGEISSKMSALNDRLNEMQSSKNSNDCIAAIQGFNGQCWTDVSSDGQRWIPRVSPNKVWITFIYIITVVILELLQQCSR